MKPGWLAKGLNRAHQEVENWPLSLKRRLANCRDFEINPRKEMEIKLYIIRNKKDGTL